jgi:shikimate 5-dehydrogenase
MSSDLRPATRPTMYFIGVTTGRASINPVFPRWAHRLGLGACELRGLDFPLRAEPARFRAAIEFIRRDPLSLGGLVTSHKLDVFGAAADLFDEIDPLSRSLGEISSVYKRAGRLHGRSVGSTDVPSIRGPPATRSTPSCRPATGTPGPKR